MRGIIILHSLHCLARRHICSGWECEISCALGVGGYFNGPLRRVGMVKVQEGMEEGKENYSKKGRGGREGRSSAGLVVICFIGAIRGREAHVLAPTCAANSP